MDHQLNYTNLLLSDINLLTPCTNKTGNLFFEITYKNCDNCKSCPFQKRSSCFIFQNDEEYSDILKHFQTNLPERLI